MIIFTLFSRLVTVTYKGSAKIFLYYLTMVLKDLSVQSFALRFFNKLKNENKWLKLKIHTSQMAQRKK